MKYIITVLAIFCFSAHVNADISSRKIVKKLERVQDSCSNERNWRSSALCLDDGIESVIELIEDQADKNRRSLKCSYVNVYGKYARGGGCNVYGCYYPGGNCNVYGCYYSGGSCNVYGCINKAKKTKKACKD